jgi:glycine C-acetyltransferase/8-amino-7-oxononanoate synthase
VYPHKDMNHLEDILKKAQPRYRRKLIVTDSVFSMDGDIAPLTDILGLGHRYDAMVMIDEAHATGVLGEKGRGLKEYYRLEKGAAIVMGTLGKALGSFGGFVAGDACMIDFLINRCRSFIYTTGLPAAVCAAALAGLTILQQEPDRLLRLKTNAQYLRDELKNCGMSLLGEKTPIIPLLTQDNESALRLSRKLWDMGLWIPAIRPPTVPKNGARLRITVSSEHSKTDLGRLVGALKEII